MIRLDLASEPRWLDLGHGVRVKAAPLTSAILIAAREDPAVRELPEEASVGERSLVFCKAVARRVILDWEGVGDAEGAAIAPTAEGIDALLDLYPLFQAWEVGYVGKGLALSAEKNASAPSPNGTSAGATATARPARAERCPDCPAILNAPQTLEGIGGLGPGAEAGRAAAGGSRGGAGLGPRRGDGARAGAGGQSAGRGGDPARDRGDRGQGDQ